MNEKELWEKFYSGGKIADYMAYRHCVNMKKEEKENSGQNNCAGTCGQGTEYR